MSEADHKIVGGSFRRKDESTGSVARIELRAASFDVDEVAR